MIKIYTEKTEIEIPKGFPISGGIKVTYHVSENDTDLRTTEILRGVVIDEQWVVKMLPERKVGELVELKIPLLNNKEGIEVHKIVGVGASLKSKRGTRFLTIFLYDFITNTVREYSKGHLKHLNCL